MWFDYETPHWVYLGSTGSGKSVTQVIPQCAFISSAKIKRSIFVTDPKGEIFLSTSKMFYDRGYRVLTLDFRNPEKSNKINILEPIIHEYENYIEYEEKAKKTEDENEKKEFNNISMTSFAETNRLITSLADMIMKEKVQSKDPFWNNSAKNLLEGLIGLFLEEYKNKNIARNQITMTSIKKFQNSFMEEDKLEKIKKYIDSKEYGMKSKDSLASILSSSENTLKSIIAVFSEKMSIFDDINVANIISSSNFKFNDLGKSPIVLYVIVPDEDKTYYALVTIVVGLMYRELVKLANNENNKKLPVEIDFLLDEFANCPPLSDIEAIVSVARSRGMRFHFFIQSFSQLDNVYGKAISQIILDNCGLVYLKTNTQETAEAISKRLGKKTIESSSISQSISLKQYNGNKSTSLIARDVMTPEEIKQLHYKMIIFPIIGYPIIRNTILYDKFLCYKKGFIERKNNSLESMKDTYFTVEDIQENNPTTNIDLFEREVFSEAVLIIKEVFEKTEYKLEYKKSNERSYIYLKLNHQIDNKIIILLKRKISNKQYHLIIKKDEIEIHLNSAF